MSKLIDLDGHFSLLTASKIDKIVAPLSAFGIKHFRYLRLYGNGSRVLLSNQPDCTRYMYEGDRYQKMWFDGEFPQYLKEGAYSWNINRLQDDSEEEEKLELEINTLLGLYHGITFVQPSDDFYEIYSFDTDHTKIYDVHKKLFLRFILYFKEQAKELIATGEHERIIIPVKKNLMTIAAADYTDDIHTFLNKTKISRYYLHGKYHNVYLTSKEVQCIYWLMQGKSAEETAIIEGSKVKTVQCHLENIRKKLHCYKQTQLVKIILKAGVLDALILQDRT